MATALLARRPQIICPVMFDQHFWAEHLSWAGLAHQCRHVGQLSAHDVMHAIKVVGGAAMRGRVEGVAAALARENGVAQAVLRIERVLTGRETDHN